MGGTFNLRNRAVVIFIITSFLCFSFFQNCGSEFKSDNTALQNSNNYEIICEGLGCDSQSDVDEIQTEQLPLITDSTQPNIQSSDCIFNGETLPNGQSILAFLSSSGEVCTSQLRVCENGILSGQYDYSTCLENSPQSCLFNGQTIGHNQSIMAYFESINAQGQKTCLSENRLCNDGQLSGSYNLASCSVSTPQRSCLFNGLTINHNESVSAFRTSSVTAGQTCERESRFCVDGQLSGSFLFNNCSVDAPRSCLFQDINVPHQGSVIAYQSLSVASGQNCVSETRTCNNGQLLGSFEHKSCSITNNQNSCQLSGQVIPHGGQILAYNTSTPLLATDCQSEIRSCNNGVLSGSYTSPQCGQLIVLPFSPTITMTGLALSHFFPYTVTSISSNPYVSISGLKVGDRVEYQDLNSIPYGETSNVTAYSMVFLIKKPLSQEPQDIVLTMDTLGIRLLNFRVSNHPSMPNCLNLEMWGDSRGGAIVSVIQKRTYLACSNP